MLHEQFTSTGAKPMEEIVMNDTVGGGKSSSSIVTRSGKRELSASEVETSDKRTKSTRQYGQEPSKITKAKVDEDSVHESDDDQDAVRKKTKSRMIDTDSDSEDNSQVAQVLSSRKQLLVI